MLPPRDVSTAHLTRTNFGGAGDLPNVITDEKFEINWYKSFEFGEGLNFHVLALLRRTPWTRLSPAGRADITDVKWVKPNCRRCDALAAYPVYRPLHDLLALGYWNKRWALALWSERIAEDFIFHLYHYRRLYRFEKWISYVAEAAIGPLALQASAIGNHYTVYYFEITCCVGI